MKRILLLKLHYLYLSVVVMVVLFVNCTDEQTEKQKNGDKGVFVAFEVSDKQQEPIELQKDSTFGSRATRVNRLPVGYNLPLADLVHQRLSAESSDGTNVSIVESTVESANSIKYNEMRTRANIITMQTMRNFSSTAYYGENITDIKQNWFYNKSTTPQGNLKDAILWSWSKRFARFYAVFPEITSTNKHRLSPPNYDGAPYIHFIVEKDVTKQQDLMTACSGVVEYKVRGIAPPVGLIFRHALTAVQFAVGQNLLLHKKIDKVEIHNAYSQGRYILSKEHNGSGAIWDSQTLDARTNFTLSIPSPYISTDKLPNTVIMGNPNDNYTFYMIPQTLTGNNVQLYIHFTDNTSITATLKGEWKPGTIKTYKISNKNSSWDYVLTTKSSPAITFDKTSTTYSVISYRKAKDGTLQPLPWHIVGFQESLDGGKTWKEETTSIPKWVEKITTNGTGGTKEEIGTAILHSDVKDFLRERNMSLVHSDPKGTSKEYYDLSTEGGSVARNTANCYIVSAPGYYKIPLVYGNGIKNGKINVSAYVSSAPRIIRQFTNAKHDVVLHTFKDHENKDISSPYINIHKSSSPATNASVVWADEKELVSNLAVVNNKEESYIKFEVSSMNIKNGNAIIAIKNEKGHIMWSWHIWVTQKKVLDKIEVTNFQKIKYYLCTEPLGWKYTIWRGSTFSQPRMVRIKIKFKDSDTKEAVVTLCQNNGLQREGGATLYQWGRKDALPGNMSVQQGSYTSTGANYSIGTGIQTPNTYYRYNENSWWFGGYIYENVWSVNNTLRGFNDHNVVKSIYDPSPIGCKIPPSNAFTGFTTTGKNSSKHSEWNVVGEWNFGWDFRTSDKKHPVIYCPSTGYRNNHNLEASKDLSYFWTACPDEIARACHPTFRPTMVNPITAPYTSRPNAGAVFSIAE